jgi:putative ABC transport system permease protein
MLAHRLVVPVAARAAQVNIPESLLTVWQAPMTVLLALAGVAIAGLGALLPARAAARLTIAEVLRTE